MQRFTDLAVWQRSRELVAQIYRITAGLPDEERFGLTSQLRRAGVSVMSSIAEGSKRRSNPEYARFLNISESSLAEAESLAIVGNDLGFVDTDSHRQLTKDFDRLARMLSKLRTRVEARGRAPRDRFNLQVETPRTLSARPLTASRQ